MAMTMVNDCWKKRKAERHQNSRAGADKKPYCFTFKYFFTRNDLRYSVVDEILWIAFMMDVSHKLPQ